MDDDISQHASGPTASTLSAGEVTTLLDRWRQGDRRAADELLPLMYQELRRLAASSLRRERVGHTLQTSDLLHEVYLRLFGADSLDVRNRGHFLAVAAKVMRRILVEHARAQSAVKRIGAEQRSPFDDELFVEASKSEHVLRVDEGLTALRRQFPRRADLVELRFFGGFSENEAAEILGVSRASVTRDWRFSKLWLRHFMVQSGAK